MPQQERNKIQMPSVVPLLFDKNPFRKLKHIPGQPISYLANPKVATKSILLSLWRTYDPDNAPQNPYTVRQGPFISNKLLLTEGDIASLLASQFFSVVRNPYARFLSGYLNKVSGRAWRKVSVRFGLPSTSRPSIPDFLLILKDTDPNKIDQHFRPQHINLLHGFAPLDFLGHLERMEDVKTFLQRHGITLESNRLNATGADTQVTDLLDNRAIASIQEIYRQDFEIYGYSSDPAQIAPKSTPTISKDRAVLEKFLALT